MLENHTAAAQFAKLADLVADGMDERMAQHISLLRASRSYIEAERGQVSPAEFATYVEDLNLAENAPGIQGIGFAPLIDKESASAVSARLTASHGFPLTIHPETDQSVRVPIALLEPQDERNKAALGFDMFSKPVRRIAIIDSQKSSEPTASGPVELVQEITADKQTGFLIYLRTEAELARISEGHRFGVVYAPFRAGDLHRSVLASLPSLPLTVRTIDLGAPSEVLFDNASEPPSTTLARNAVLREINVAGRRWQLTITPTNEHFQLRSRTASITVGVLSGLLLAAVAVAMNSFSRSLRAAQQAAFLAERQAAERSLLLREMQHRIKNHIARIQAIARQSIRGSESLTDFERIFGGRLAAMAKAQDAIGRDGTMRADLHTLLGDELAQILPPATVHTALSGPSVSLGGKEAQAVGLIAHELLTNTMKYGFSALTPKSQEWPLTIAWHVEVHDGEQWLHLDWVEESVPSSEWVSSGRAGGFGTQLIEALVEGDLGGTFVRDFQDNIMKVAIGFPLSQSDY